MRIPVLVLSLACFIAALSVRAQRPTGELEAAMAEATGLARDGFAGFIDALRRNDGEAFAVKVPAVERGAFTHVWLSQLRIEGEGLIGVEVISEAGVSGRIRRIRFEDVIDWTYREDGFTYGAFTTCIYNPTQPALPANIAGAAGDR